MVDEARFPNTRPGNDCNDINIPVCPGIIQKGDILLSTKKIASRYGQPGYGNLLRSKSCRQLARSEARNDRRRLLHTLTSDSTPCVHGARYRRHGLQKFSRVLKTVCRVFFEKYLK